MKKRVILLLACLWSIIAFLVIKTTYAKYVTSVNGSTNIGIASWNMLVNNQDILANSDFSQTLSLTFPEETYHIAGYIVPDAVGYFDLTIDSTEVSLNYSYTITISTPVTSNVTDMKLKGYSLDGGTTVTDLNAGVTQITNNVANNVNSVSIRVYVQWSDDSATETMNDITDTSVAVNSGKAVIQANINFEQIEDTQNTTNQNAVNQNSVGDPENNTV